MAKITKFNEFVDNEVLLIRQLIEQAECTNKPDLVSISQREPYRKVIEFGEKVIPILLERIKNSPIWDIGLKELTGEGLNSLEFTTSERIEYWKKWAVNN